MQLAIFLLQTQEQVDKSKSGLSSGQSAEVLSQTHPQIVVSKVGKAADAQSAYFLSQTHPQIVASKVGKAADVQSAYFLLQTHEQVVVLKVGRAAVQLV